MLLFIHGLLAAIAILFVFGALFFDFIAILRPQRFYPMMAMICAVLGMVSFFGLAILGGILIQHLPVHTAALTSTLYHHVGLAIGTILLFILTWFVRLAFVRYRFRMILYFLLEVIVLGIAITTAHYGTLLIFIKN